MRFKFTFVFTLLLALLVASTANAQTQLPPPANDLAICFQQEGAAADSYTLSFDNGNPEPLAVITPAGTDDAPLRTYCNEPGRATGWTHAFRQPASRFVVRATPYTLVVRGTNVFGSTSGPSYTVRVGVAPGEPRILHVGQLP